MVHDDTKADIWYHDAITPTSILGNYLEVIRMYAKSGELSEIDTIIDKCQEQLTKNKNILYERYLEDRRVEK